MTRRGKDKKQRFAKEIGIMKDMFTEAIIVEQKRIQRLIDLSRPAVTGRGNLKLKKRGKNLCL